MSPKAPKKKSKYVWDARPIVDLEKELILDSKGRRITQEYVDRAVTDVYEKLGRGRPSLSGTAHESPQVTFRLTPALRKKAEQRARQEGKSVSQVAREALTVYLASSGAAGRKPAKKRPAKPAKRRAR